MRWSRLTKVIAALASYAWLSLGGAFVLTGLLLLARTAFGESYPWRLLAVLVLGGSGMLACGALTQAWLHRARKARHAAPGFEVVPLAPPPAATAGRDGKGEAGGEAG